MPALYKMDEGEIEELVLQDWFNEYKDVDDFLIEELEKAGLEFPTKSRKPHKNTVEAIKLLLKNKT